MTIQEAIKSGKNFRRKTTQDWLYVAASGAIRTCDGLEKYPVYSQCVLADDWELQPVRKELSKEDIMTAYLKITANLRHQHHEGGIINDMCTELGL